MEEKTYSTETFFDTKEEAIFWIRQNNLTDYSLEDVSEEDYPEGKWHVRYN